MMERLPFTYVAKGRYWRFRHNRTGDVAISGEPFSEGFLEAYKALISKAGVKIEDARIARIVGVNADALRTGFVYFIGWAGGPVKIGVAIDVDIRLRTLQCACPYELAVLAKSPGGTAKERSYHRRFAAHRLHGEWFERAPEIVGEIEKLNALPLPRSVREGGL